MIKLRNTLLLIVFLLAAFSCNNRERYMEKAVGIEMMESSGDVPPPPPPPGVKSAGQEKNSSTKLVKKGELTIASNNLEATKALIYKFVKECNGYVTHENLVKDELFAHINISLNVQASRFDVFLELLDSAKINIVSSTFSVEDVSMKYIDDSTRLQNKKKLEEKYRELLSRAKDMKDLLEIEEKIEEIQSEIEVRESQLKMLEKQIAYSEFTIRIEKDEIYLPYDARNKFTYRIGQGIAAGWEGVKSILVFLLAIWPLYVVIGIIFFWVKAIIKRRKKQYKG